VSANLPPLAPPPPDVETSACTRLALLSTALCWTLAAVRLGMALGRHEAGVDPVLALGVVLGLPTLVLLRWRTTIERRSRLVHGAGANVIPFPAHRARASNGRAS
jgi:hypothetical protein